MSPQISLQITTKRGYIVTYKGQHVSSDNLKTVLSLVKKAEKNNILLSSDLISNLSTMDPIHTKEIKDQFFNLYPDFGGQIFRSVFASGQDLEDEHFTLNDYIDQMQHYFVSYGLGEIDYDVFKIDEKRKIQLSNISRRKDKQTQNCTFKIIGTKSVQEFIQDGKKIIEMPIVFGEQQKDFIFELNRFGFLGSVVNSSSPIKVKENLFYLIGLLGKDFVKETDILKTPTDILRYCYWVSDLDYGTLEPLQDQKIRLKTTDKKIIMKGLNTNIIENYGEMKPYYSQWLSVSKALYPGSEKFNGYSKTQKIFDLLRNKNSVETFNSLTEKLIRENKIIDLIDHLSKKPGVLMRQLDMIIRRGNKESTKHLVQKLSEIKINPKLNIQVRKWLEYRSRNSTDNRIFNVKGKSVQTDKSLDKLKKKRTLKVSEQLKTILLHDLKGKELFGQGKIYLDPLLKKYTVPYELRHNSRADGKIFTPGTRLPLGDSEFIRLFTAWTGKNNEATDTDIDLGALLIKETNTGLESEEIAYYNQGSGNVAVHSGDFTSARAYDPKDGKITAEFIDLSVDNLVEQGYRYIISSEFIYARAKNYDSINAWSGVQLLSGVRTEKTEFINLNDYLFRMKLGGSFQSHTALAVDLQTREIVIIDQYSEEKDYINVYQMQQKMQTYKRQFFDSCDFKENMYDLLVMYCEANDYNISPKEESDIICSYNSEKDQDKIQFNISDNLEKIMGLLN